MADSDEQRFRDALAASSRAFKGAATQAMRSLGVHPGQNFLLEELRTDEPLTTGELARRMRIEVPTAVRMIQRMEVAGLLARAPDPDDRRRARISLTPKGREMAEAVPGVLDRVAETALHGIDHADRRRLAELLEQVSENLGWPRDEPTAD